jgi:hypothetical protein
MTEKNGGHSEQSEESQYLFFERQSPHEPQEIPPQKSTSPHPILEVEGNIILEAENTSATISLDEFQALEQKVLRAVEIVRREREARTAAEAEVATLRGQLDALAAASNATQSQITTLNQEREAVRLRVEKMLAQMDDLV